MKTFSAIVESELRKNRPSRLSQKRLQELEIARLKNELIKLRSSNDDGQKFAISNPVAPTPLSLENNKIEPALPVAQPVTQNAAVWAALAQIGSALQVLAGAQLPGGGPALPPAVAGALVDESVCVVELVNQFLLAKARSGRSDRYLRGLRNSLKNFHQGRAHVPISRVTSEQIEKWMQRAEWQPRTQKGYLSDVRVMFNFAVRRGWLQRNPAAGVEIPTVALPDAVEIHSPAQVAAVLAFARRYDLNICRALAVRYFAGLRSGECEKLTEAFIGEKFLEVCASAAKTRRRRLVTIQPNLRAWLNLGGALPVRGNKSNVWRDFNKAMTKATGVPWFHNVTRHCFCSYHLAEFASASKTAIEAGHSETMLFAHYRELTENSAAFWAIVPK